MDEVKQLVGAIKKGDIKPIYFLMGEEAYYIDKISDFIEDNVLDEAEKGFAGVNSGGTTDGGVTERVFGSWLSWMQERPQDKLIYIVMTVNNVSALPPELLRKGRFDEIKESLGGHGCGNVPGGWAA